MSEQLTLWFKHSLVKRRALQVLRYGSVLVNLDSPTIVSVPRGEEVYSDLLWHRIKSQEWLDDLTRKVNAREQLMRYYGKEQALLDRRHENQLAELERKQKKERQHLNEQHTMDLIANRQQIEALLAQVEHFEVQRDARIDPLPWVPDQADIPVDQDDVPF